MVDLLIFLGRLCIVVAGIMLFKKRWSYKKAGILAGISVVVVILASALTGPSIKKGYDVDKHAGQKPPAQTQDIQLAADVKNSSLAETNSSPSKQEDKKTENNRQNVIPGITADDIKLNLEKTRKLKFTGPKMGSEFIRDDGEAVEPNTGIELRCHIFGALPLGIEIEWVDFLVDASPVAGLVSLDDINTVTEGYFGYCATVAYNGAEPAKARQWVRDNVRKAIKPGNVLSTQIGPVEFEMFGTEYLRTLRIKPAR